MTSETMIDRSAMPREKVADRDKWNLSVIFPDVAAWEKEKARLIADLPELARFKGTLGSGPDELLAGLEALMSVGLRVERLGHYAARLRDEDLSRAEPAGMVDSVTKLASEVAAATSYFEPEILAIAEKTLESWMATSAFADYDRYIENLLRQREHVLSPAEEKILASASALSPVLYNTYSTFSDADLKRPTIKDSSGKTVEMSPANYRIYRQSHDREDRQRAFESLWGLYDEYKNTFANLLSGQVSYYNFVATARNYDSVLHMALHENEVPVEFYHTLIDRVTDHLSSFHKYLGLRRKMLGISGKQFYYDIYPSLAGSVDRRYPIDRCVELTMEAVKPLGDDYAQRMSGALAPESGWLDLYPNKGKRSGAYMAGCYDVHPLILLNHNGDYESLSTLVHEMGHAMHSVYSQANQPYPKASYSIFVAEVASTLNETLLIEHLLETETDDAARRFFLSEYLNGFRGTVFRQIMFAEFEREIYAMSGRREPLTGQALNELYLGLLRRYHGHDEGAMYIDELYGSEWAYIPHFYYRFYVYQYSSSHIAATALVEKILAEGPGAAAQYVDNLLKAGCAKDPIQILKDAGVDLTSSEPYEIAFGKFDRYVDRLAALAS